MRERLRKKLRLGEFREYGFEICCRFDTERLEWDTFWDHLVGFVESRGLEFGGGGRPEDWSVVVGKMGRGSATEEDRAAVRAWFAERPEVIEVEAGELRDLWHDGSWTE